MLIVRQRRIARNEAFFDWRGTDFSRRARRGSIVREVRAMSGPQRIMIVRHAEKPADPPPFGVNEDGEEDKYSLSVRGWQRAGALVRFFEEPYRKGIQTPAKIFAAGTADEDRTVEEKDAKSLRPYQTALPLARKLGIKVDKSVPVGREEAIVETLERTRGIVLVAWEHKRIPLIARAFAPEAPNWDDDCFDVVWVFKRTSSGHYKFKIVNQDLLDGDAPA